MCGGCGAYQTCMRAVRCTVSDAHVTRFQKVYMPSRAHPAVLRADWMVSGLLLGLVALAACFCVLLCICACRRWRHVHSKGYRTVGGAWEPGGAEVTSDVGSAGSYDDDDDYDDEEGDRRGRSRRAVDTRQRKSGEASILSDEEYMRIYGQSRGGAETLADMILEADSTPHEWSDIERDACASPSWATSARVPADEMVLSF